MLGLRAPRLWLAGALLAWLAGASPEAYTKGNLLLKQQHWELAITQYRQALSEQPDHWQAGVKLAECQLQLGRLSEAEAAYRRVLAQRPEWPPAYSNLGIVLSKQGRLQESISMHRAAVGLDAELPVAHFNLGTTLKKASHFPEAVHHLQIAHTAPRQPLRVLPHLLDALFGSSRWGEAHRLVNNDWRLRRGRPFTPETAALWWGRDQLASPPSDERVEIEGANMTTIHKLEHDSEQIRWLVSEGKLSAEHNVIAADLEAVAKQLEAHPTNSIGMHTLNQSQMHQIGRFYNRAHYVLPAPSLAPRRAVRARSAAEIERIELQYATEGVFFLDGFLTDEALEAVTQFCLGSTIWHESKPMGYLGAYVDDGFAAPLLFQIAEEVQQMFPHVFAGNPLKYTWAYKYTQEMKGINVHADQASVNVNWWVTPDESNLDMSSGGLRVYKEPPPKDWSFEKYNAEMSEDRIRAFLKKSKAGSITIAHRRNRVVMFDSTLFHETDKFSFKKGYRNRRINVTMLFGKNPLETKSS